MQRPGDGHVENFDFEYIPLSLLTFGLWKRPWEGTATPGYTGVGMFDAEHFDPGHWKTHVPFLPFEHRDVYDMFWATKTIMRFTEKQIYVALQQGRFEDERAPTYLTQVLVKRQRKIGRYWFSRVNPLDLFEISGTDTASVCFDDLLVAYDLEPGAGGRTGYRLASYDYAGAATGWRGEARPNDRGRACVAGVKLGSREQSYTIVRIDTQRGVDRLAPVEVHLARGERGALRVIGVNRR